MRIMPVDMMVWHTSISAVVAHHAFYARFEQHGNAYTVDHKHNVVAHEHRGNKHILTAVERVDDAACQPFFL